MIDNIIVGKTIAKLRQSRDLTQQQLAAALNVSHQAVSKWENGAALPDVQTLMNLSELFGVTLEQLLNGDIPADRTAPAGKSPIEEGIQNVGNFVNSFVNGLFNSGTSRTSEPDAAEASNEDAEAPVETEADDDTDTAEAPAEAEEAPVDADNADAGAEEAPFDIENLLRTAPFMSKAAVSELLLAHKDALAATDIAKFAPFITRECLEQLIQAPQADISWDTLRRIAPFLKREMVDRLTQAIAHGEKFVKDADQACRNPEELGRSIGEMSQRIGSGVERILRRAAQLGGDAMNEAGRAINELFEGLKTREERVDALRRAAMLRAIEDNQWDWIAAHIDDLNDEELRRSVAEKANAAGMHDWVLEHIEGYVDPAVVENALNENNWGWLGEHVWRFEPALQQQIALRAVETENWLWLTGYAELLELGDHGAHIAKSAYEAGERDLSLTLAGRLERAQLEAFANDIIAAGDDEFLDCLSDNLGVEYLSRLCLSRAENGNWEGALRFVAKANEGTVEQLMERAIAEGRFDIIDRLNPYL